MTRRDQKKIEKELLNYKFLSLFVLGFCIGIFLGTAI